MCDRRLSWRFGRLRSTFYADQKSIHGLHLAGEAAMALGILNPISKALLCWTSTPEVRPPCARRSVRTQLYHALLYKSDILLMANFHYTGCMVCIFSWVSLMFGYFEQRINNTAVFPIQHYSKPFPFRYKCRCDLRAPCRSALPHCPPGGRFAN